eukprot:987045-Amphidinium_carterae.1
MLCGLAISGSNHSMRSTALSESEPELASSRDARSVATQTFELPLELPRTLQLDLSNCRVYVLWHISGAAFQLPGIHIGQGLSAWLSLLHLAPDQQYAPGVVRVRRFSHLRGENDNDLLVRAREAFVREARGSNLENVITYYWPDVPRSCAGDIL